jgi:hypothetical protein
MCVSDTLQLTSKIKNPGNYRFNNFRDEHITVPAVPPALTRLHYRDRFHIQFPVNAYARQYRYAWRSVPLLTTHPDRALSRRREFSGGLSTRAESSHDELYATGQKLSTHILLCDNQQPPAGRISGLYCATMSNKITCYAGTR